MLLVLTLLVPFAYGQPANVRHTKERGNKREGALNLLANREPKYAIKTEIFSMKTSSMVNLKCTVKDVLSLTSNAIHGWGTSSHSMHC